MIDAAGVVVKFLAEPQVLWGESIGLLKGSYGLYTIYFAHLPLTRFDDQRGKLIPLGLKVYLNSAPWAGGQACPPAHDKTKNLP